MELGTGILKLAEIANKNGGQLPADLAQFINDHQIKDLPKSTNGTTKKLVSDIVNRALWS